MKKFSKILAAILTLVLIVGVMATVTSADASSGARSLGTMSDSSKNTDFEDGNAFGITVSDKDTGEMVSQLVNTGNNTYNRFYFNSVGANGEALNSLDQIGLPSFYISNLLSYDYLTIDFDIVADQYTNGKELITIDEYNALSEEDKAAFSPSYVESWVYWEFKQIASNYSTKTISFSKIDGDWYIISNDGDKENRYPLPKEAGVWTHITQVVEISNIVTYVDGDSTATCTFREFMQKVNNKTIASSALISVSLSETRSHIYVDGEYAFELDGWAAQNKDNELYETYIDNNCNDSGKAFAIKYGRIRGGHDTSTRITQSFSIGLDNMNVRTYADYTGDLHNAVKSRDALFACNDTYINAYYQYPEGTPYRAKLTTEDKKVTYYYLPAGAIKDAGPNSEIELFTNCIAPIKPTQQFAVKHNGYSISVDTNSGYILSEHADADKYSVRRALYSDYADIVWDYEGELYDVTRTLSGSVPTYFGDTTVVDGFDARTNTYTRFLGWSTDPNATAPSALPVLSAGDELYVYPVYDRFETKYLIYAPDGSLVPINGSYKSYGDINTIGTAISSAPTGSKVLLLSDVDMAKATAINITKAVNIEIDLNGYSLDYGFVGLTVPSYMATITSNGAKLSIYSSKPGSKILAYSANDKNAMNDAACLFNVNAAATIVLGNGTDDLLVSANTILSGNVASGKATLTINGGTYVSESSAYSTALVSVKGGGNFEMNINDAYLSAKNILFKSEGDIVVNATINDSCIVRASSGVIGYVIGTTTSASTYTVNNSTIIGKIFLDSGKGNLIVGEGAKFTVDPTTTNAKGFTVTVADGCVMNTVSEKITVSFDSFDFTAANKVITCTPAVRTITSTVLVSVSATVSEPDNGGNEVEDPNTPPANEEEVLDADTPVIPAPKSIVHATKTMNVHDAPVSITLGVTEGNNSSECDALSIIDLANVEALPTKEEEN